MANIVKHDPVKDGVLWLTQRQAKRLGKGYQVGIKRDGFSVVIKVQNETKCTKWLTARIRKYQEQLATLKNGSH